MLLQPPPKKKQSCLPNVLPATCLIRNTQHIARQTAPFPMIRKANQKG